MKNKIIGLISLSILSLILFLGAVSAVTLSEWDFEADNLVPSTDLTSGATLVVSDNRTATFPAGNAPSAVTSMSTTGWDVADRYIELDLSTVGYENLIMKFDYQRSSQGPTQFKIQYSSDGTTFTDLSGSTITISDSFTTNPMSTFDFSSITAIDDNPNTKFRILVDGLASSSAGTFRIDNLRIEGSAITVPSTNIPEEITACSTMPNPGSDLRVDIKDIIVLEGFGDDEEWLPFDEIEVEIKIQNDANEDMNDLVVEWGVYDKNADDWYMDEEENDFNLKDGDEKTIVVTFKLDDDIDDLEDADLMFYAWVNGELEDSEIEICESDSQDIDMIIEDEFVILDNIEYLSPLMCGEDFQITADVWNIGDEDQDDVSVLVFNKELGIDEKVIIGDIDAFEDDEFFVSLEIPDDADEKLYIIQLQLNNEDNEVFENDFDDEESVFDVGVIVEGGCVFDPELAITSSLESGGMAGEELVIKGTFTNTASKTRTFDVMAIGYVNWAELVDVSQDSLVLRAGESEDVLFTFLVDEDVSGNRNFNMELTTEDGKIISQPVSVLIEEKTAGGFRFPSVGGAISSENWFLWVIGAVNFILILLIIFIAVRLVKRKE